MMIKNALYNIRDNLFRSMIGNIVIYRCKTSGIYWRFARYYAKKRAQRNFLTPTPQMLESRKFFNENADRVDKVTSWLADDDSKDCYRKMIEFRCNYDVDSFPSCNENEQYFFHDFINYSSEEVLIDCGAFTGDSLDFFIRALKRYGGKYKRIVAFEPDPDNYEVLKKKKIPKLTVINTGVYSSDTTLYFEGGHSRRSFFVDHTSSQGLHKLPVRSIDDCIECRGATFIKMDVEGSEFPALQGAEKIIRRNKPILAISIYHSDEDMVCIAEWIHELNLGYQFYVRQHNAFNIAETVLYAIQQSRVFNYMDGK